ncbi:MAG: hypothetical protein MHMPM18_002324 [Marteilia pararefringens]
MKLSLKFKSGSKKEDKASTKLSNESTQAETLIAPYSYNIPNHPIGMAIELSEGFTVLPKPSSPNSKKKSTSSSSSSKNKSISQDATNLERLVEVEKFIREEDLEELRKSSDKLVLEFVEKVVPDDWNKFQVSVAQDFVAAARRNVADNFQDYFHKASLGDLEFFKALLASDTPVEWGKRNETGNSLLHLAAAHSSNRSLVEFLIDKGGIAINNDLGNTPLMECFFIRHMSDETDDIIRYLLEKGSDINICNSLGQTVFDMATDENHRLMLNELKNKGQPNALDALYAVNGGDESEEDE